MPGLIKDMECCEYRLGLIVHGVPLLGLLAGSEKLNSSYQVAAGRVCLCVIAFTVVQCQRQRTSWGSLSHARARCLCWPGLAAVSSGQLQWKLELAVGPTYMQEFLPIGHLNHLESENFKTMMAELKGSIDKGVAFANKA